MLDMFININYAVQVVLSLTVSFVIGLIANKVIMRKPVKLKHLLNWYVTLAVVIGTGVLFMCMLTYQGELDFFLCIRKYAPWLTLLAVHTLILILYIDHKDSQKVKLSARANLLARALILLAAFFFILAEYPLFLFPAIAVITVPLLTIIHKCDQSKKTIAQKTCCQ